MKITFTKYGSDSDWGVEVEGDCVHLGEGITIMMVSTFPGELHIALADLPCRISRGPRGAVWLSSSDHFQPARSELVFERDRVRTEATA